MAVCVQAQKNNDSKKTTTDTGFIEKLLKKHPESFQHLLDFPDSFNVQIFYTQINRDRQNRPSFKEFSYGLNNNKYFYPASTVKMPVAFLALERLNEMKIKGLDRNATMVTDSSTDAQDVVYTQPLAVDSRASVEHYIKQIFLVSDNDAYNRLYEFLGPAYIQKKLTEKGYPDAIIRHRLNITRTIEENKNTNPVSFYDTSGKLIYQQPAKYSQAVYSTLDVKLGNGYYNNGKLIHEPFNFSTKNRVYLQDQHHILQAVLFQEAIEKNKRFLLTNDDIELVKHWMSAYPKESKYPYYDSTDYWDAYGKFLLYGSSKEPVMPNIRIFSKEGDAYGFLIDIAYIVDFENNIEFILSATISCNSDGIFNDDRYDYERLGFPFMKNLGKTIYEYELTRKRKYPADLSKFRINY